MTRADLHAAWPVLAKTLTAMQMLAAAMIAIGLASHPAHAETVHTVTQMSYDVNERLECTAVRMNPATFASTPASACALGVAGAAGPDRIFRNVYDAAGQLITEQRAYGTALQQDYATHAYTVTGKPAWVEDANANRTEYSYDGFDRLTQMTFPSQTVGAHVANPADYEEYSYDDDGRRTSMRLRSGDIIRYHFDALGRECFKDFAPFVTDPAACGASIAGAGAADVFRDYDLAGRLLSARYASFGGQGVIYAYDSAGRLSNEASYGRALAYQYDQASNRTRVTWPDAFYAQYTFDAMNRVDQIKENGAAVLADYAYDATGRRASIMRANNAVTTFGYDGVSRLTDLNQHLSASATNDQSYHFDFTPASQVSQRTSSNANYTWSAPAVSRSYTRDGLNRYTSVGGVTFVYAGGDGQRGNLTSDGSRNFAYDLENHLIAVSGSTSLSLDYDPTGRLRQTSVGANTTQFLYDGDRLSVEYDGAGVVLRRYVHGPSVDEPLVWYEGASVSAPRWLIADNQGSTIVATDASGALVGNTYSYGPYGEPDTPNGWIGARFRYTGQITLPEAQLYFYKARVYDPVLGRFLQTDPVGYDAGDMNLYAYVGNDPLNLVDPTGMEGVNCVEGIACQTLSDTQFDAAVPQNIQQFESSIIGQKFGEGTSLSDLQSNDQYHAYSNTSVLCTGCAGPELDAAYASSPAPTLFSSRDSPVQTGDVTFDVAAAPAGAYGAPVPLPGGAVSHAVDPSGALANITTSVHTLNPGYIIRWTEVAPGGVVLSHTLGRGIGGAPRLNEFYGPRLFHDLDRKIGAGFR